MDSVSVDFSDFESTVLVPTTLEIARMEIVQKLEARARTLGRRNRDLERKNRDLDEAGILCVNLQALQFWRAEASKLDDYVELAKCAVGNLRDEIDNLNAIIRNLKDKNNLLEKELSKGSVNTV
ncbi:hypothetical protein HWV62_20852 [Athelia sp. TMB]|nr:hypothetical protein HWV62_20852 [Athelia sp. TMB]